MLQVALEKLRRPSNISRLNIDIINKTVTKKSSLSIKSRNIWRLPLESRSTLNQDHQWNRQYQGKQDNQENRCYQGKWDC